LVVPHLAAKSRCDWLAEMRHRAGNASNPPALSNCTTDPDFCQHKTIVPSPWSPPPPIRLRGHFPVCCWRLIFLAHNAIPLHTCPVKTLTLLLVLLALPLWAEAPVPAGASFDLGFSPGGSSLAVVLKAVESAKVSILVAAYEFTSREIADALVAAADKGVKVQVVADFKASHDRASVLDRLRRANIPVRLDRRYAIHHHKFMVVDGETLETGSFNYTEAAVKHNAENALVLWHVAPLAQAYTKEWNRLWAESTN